MYAERIELYTAAMRTAIVDNNDSDRNGRRVDHEAHHEECMNKALSR